MKARTVLPFVCGLIFAAGLGLSGMTQPAKVAAFLDVAGNWDPSLMLVMGGALAVDAVAFRFILRRKSPLFGGIFHLPSQQKVDARLLGGAALFGAGWGLSGYCPGPAVVSALSGGVEVATFVGFMLLGMVVYRGWERRSVLASAAVPSAAASTECA